jgi:tetratricopeptide (TPR) repeat protein
VAAGRVHLDKAAHYLVLAGDQAERAFAHGEAERHYQLALDLARQLGDGSQEAAALEKLGVVLRLTARYAEAAETLERAAQMSREGGDLEGELQAMAELGRACYFGSMVEEGIARLKPVIDRAGTDQPSAGLVALHISLSLLLRERHGGYQAGFEAADRAVKLANVLGDSRARAPALVQRAAMLRVLGHHDEARGALVVAISLVEQLGDLETLQRAVHSLAIAYRLTGKFDQATVHFEHAPDLARRLGDPARVAYALAWLGEIRFLSGAWKEARALLEQGLELARSCGSPLVPSCLARGLGNLYAAEGKWEEAIHYLEDCMRAAGGGPDDALLEDMVEAQCLLAELDLLEGRWQAALDRLEQTAKRFGPHHQRFTPWVLAWAYLETGDAERADVLMQQRIARANLENSPFRLVDALRTRGMGLARLARIKEADTMFCQAVSVARSMPHPYAEARALYEWGCANTESGQLKHAGERLEEALVIFRELGAQPYIERTEQALNALALRS